MLTLESVECVLGIGIHAGMQENVGNVAIISVVRMQFYLKEIDRLAVVDLEWCLVKDLAKSAGLILGRVLWWGFVDGCKII